MAPITLYYLDLSPPVRSVDLIIHALGLKVDYKPLNLLKKEHLTSEFTKVNPLNTVPAIIDTDGFILWESRAIMTYLIAKYGKDDSLYPKDLKKRAIVDQRLHFSNDAFSAEKQITRPLLLENVKSVPAEKVARVEEIQESIEKLLEGNKFIAGDELTVADYSYVTMLDVLEALHPTGDKYPLSKAWFERCKSVMKDFDKVNSEGARKLVALIKGKL